MSNSAESHPDFGPVIFRYTRRQALEDGVLVDLTEWAKETGFVIPVACTRAVWDQWIAPPAEMVGYGQSERGRAHDVLWLLFVAIRKAHTGGDYLTYQVGFQQEPGKATTVTLQARCGPGDDGAPVLTILLPGED